MVAQLAPGPNLVKLFKGTDATRQCNECIGTFSHHSFAIVHGFYNMQFGAARVGPFFFNQGARYDAHHAATCSKGGICNDAHQPISAATVHKLPAVLCNPLTHLLGRFSKGWFIARLGAAVNAN